MKELDISRVQVGRGTGAWEFGQLQSKGPHCLEDKVFLSVTMSAFFAAVLWEYVPAFRALGRKFLDGLAGNILDPDPESAFVISGFLLSVWLLIKALRLVTRLLEAPNEN